MKSALVIVGLALIGLAYAGELEYDPEYSPEYTPYYGSESAVGEINLDTSAAVIIGKYNSMQVYPTCALDSSGNIWTVVDNYTDPTVPRDIVNVNADDGQILSGDVTVDFTVPKLYWSNETLYVLNLGGGYLYEYSAEGLGSALWSFSGNYGSKCNATFDGEHGQFWTVCSDGISAYNYITKKIRSIDNIYNIQSIAYDSKTDSVYGLADAAGNLLLYRINQLMDWTLVDVIWGYTLAAPIRTSITSPGELTFIGHNGLAFHVVTVDVLSGEVLSDPYMSAPIVNICSLAQ